MTSPDIQEQKRRLRANMREKRGVENRRNPQSSIMLWDIFNRHIQLEPRAVVAAYMAFRDEMDPAAIIENLRAAGHKIALPIVGGKAEALAFRLYEPGDELTVNAMGIAEPLADAPLVEPDILLVPLLAFDRQRNRLGYGGGFYDRTIAGLRGRKSLTAIGLGYAGQEVDRVPVRPDDMRLDKIVTEFEVF